MNVMLVSPRDYAEAFPTHRHAYASEPFIALNAHKYDAIRHFIGYDGAHPRLGIVLGYRNGAWASPVSAPFGDIECRRPQSLEHIYDFISELRHILGSDPVAITLPPAFYSPAHFQPLHGVLANYAAKTVWDYNYHYPLSQASDPEAYMTSQARNKYRNALLHPFAFAKTDDVEAAYEVIRLNRQSKGYPLAMSLDQVKATIAPAGPVKADFFLLTDTDTCQHAAAAMAYHAAPGIIQIIYWGDAPGHAASRPMNILPFRIFSHYAAQGLSIVDIGPSSKDGIPSPGLCAYKESIGCHLSLKPTFCL